jgi:hypothetical protein
MSFLGVSAALPRNLISALSACDHVIVQRGDVPIISLVDSDAGANKFTEFLCDEQEVDPVLDPHFGSPISPYISPTAQLEVYNLLATFQQRVAADFKPNANIFPYLQAAFPLLGGGIQYHHAKIAIHAVQMEIQGLARFGPNCPALSALPPGHTICDLRIIYANVIILLRVRKN